MLRRAFLTSAGAIALSGAAFAAEPIPAPPPPPPPPMWTGFYAGLNAGGTWSSSDSFDVTTVPISAFSPAINAFPLPASRAAALAATGFLPVSEGGFVGGGQIGYNYQFGPSFVAGVEADIQGIAGSHESFNRFGAVNALSSLGFPGNFATALTTVDREVDYLGTVRGRLGWLLTPALLVYGDGGFAYGGIRSNTNILGQNTGVNLGLCCGNPLFFAGRDFSSTRGGWTAGGGVEWMFAPNWSAKVEYLYYDLGSVTDFVGFSTAIARPPGVIPAGTVIYTLATQTSTRFNGNIVRAGINWHFFAGPPPVVAKY